LIGTNALAYFSCSSDKESFVASTIDEKKRREMLQGVTKAENLSLYNLRTATIS
jgi:hypothetical protein